LFPFEDFAMASRRNYKPAADDKGLSRREFLRAGAVSAGVLGGTLADLQAASPGVNLRCILLFLVGGPSQLDTWDPKPNAPSNIRGPFKAIRTTVPGFQLAETFPLMAQRAERFAVVRSVHHDDAPIHETGQQLLQTGQRCREGAEYPHYGAVLSHLRGPVRADVPAFVQVPGPMGNTGVDVSHGQGAGLLGRRHEPVAMRVTSQLSGESDSLRERYGRHRFGQSCLLARRLVENGVRLVTVNMFDSVFNQLSWDCHADGATLATDLNDYRETICPQFDQAYTALLDDLYQSGQLDNTLVVAMGEFGRTPKLNPRGGRDHWPGVWSVLFAGAGGRGGQVVGSSDAHAAEPRDRPVTPAEIAATVYHALGVNPATTLPTTDGRQLALVEAAPVDELF